jgi:hypothetical protein
MGKNTHWGILNSLKEKLSPYYQGKLVGREYPGDGASCNYAAGQGPYLSIAERGRIFTKRHILNISKNPFCLIVTILDKKANDVVRGELSELLNDPDVDVRIEEEFH